MHQAIRNVILIGYCLQFESRVEERNEWEKENETRQKVIGGQLTWDVYFLAQLNHNEQSFGAVVSFILIHILPPPPENISLE